MITDKNIVSKEEDDSQNVSNITSSSSSNENLVQILVEKENTEKISVCDLGVNDRKIILHLNDEDELNHHYTFKGLMRKTNLHQQSLSRALHRLESLELIEKTIAGYKIKKKLKFSLSKINETDFSNTSIKLPIESVGFTQLIQTYLPSDTMTYDIITALTGKWFGTLRWLGLVEGDNEYVLQWISTDHKVQVNLRILSRYVIIETNATNKKERMEAMIYSYRILDYATKLAKNKIDSYSPTQYELNLLD